MKTHRSSLAIAAVLVAAGCSRRGSGVLAEESRQVPLFTSVEVSGAMQVEITAGTDVNVVVVGDDNLVGRVRTDVEGGRLHIDLDPGLQQISPTRPLRVRVGVPTLSAIGTSGASSVEAAGLTGTSSTGQSDLALEASGASRIAASGRCNHLDVRASGAATVKAPALSARDVTALASGASHVEVFAADSLAADASGASSIVYLGKPKKVQPQASGVSHIRAAD